MKNKHLTLSDRNDIQIGIEQLKPFSAIAAKLGKDPSTISKEVRRNRVVKKKSVTSNCETCPLLKKAPYVCNACPKKRSNCGYQKQFYYAKRAQLDYEAKLSDSRTGVALNKEEFYRMDEIVSSAIQKDNTSTTSSHQMNCRLQELLSTDTLKRLSFHKAYWFPPCREIQKTENQKPPTNS